MTTTIFRRMFQRRDTALNWSTIDPVLGDGEFGYERDTLKLKIGDGVTPWLDLPYFGGGVGGGVESYVHTQAVPSAVWTITHNLGQQLVDGTTVFSLDYQIQYQNVIVECLNPNQCRLFFGDPVAGAALIQR